MTFSIGPGGRRLAGVAALLGVALVCGCAVKTSVVAVPTGTRITTIYVENNPKVLMDGLLPEILAQVRAQGFQAVAYDGPRPGAAVDYMTFTANWRWHWAMYLTFFRATLYRDGRVLGTVEYNARRAGLNPDKYGHTAEKIRPLLRSLLRPAQGTVAVSGPAKTTIATPATASALAP
jgi:hypothetical protein